MRLLIALLFCWCAGAQSFDVASVRPHPGDDIGFGVKMPAEGQFRATGATAKMLVMLAFDVQETQIVGGPEWTDSEKWDVEAKSESTAHSADETRRMLQTMLRERFGLRAHRETRQRAAYVLTVARGGEKFKAATEGATNIRVAAGSIALARGSIAQMTQVLAGAVGRPVVDRTGLSGTYDLALRWDEGLGGDYGSVFTALKEQLGLQMDAAQVGVEVVVIEGMDRASEN